MLKKITFKIAVLGICMSVHTVNAQDTRDPYNEAEYEEIYMTWDDDMEAKTGIYSELNLLKNPGFETVATVLADGEYEPADWYTTFSGGFAAGVGGIRVNRFYAGLPTAMYEGENTLLWRDDAWDKTGVCLYQPVKLEPNTCYMIQFATLMHGQNRISRYYVGLGFTPDGMEYGSEPVRMIEGGIGTDLNQYICFITPEEVEDECYFTISNDEFEKSAGHDAIWTIIHLDRMTMVAETKEVNSIASEYNEEVKVTVQNRAISVEGADEYTVYSISGAQVNSRSELNAGLYIVSVNGKQYKVLVK